MNAPPFHVYAAFDARLKCLYVGQTESLTRRMRQHQATSHWYDRATYYSVVPCGSRAEALEVERERIAALRPLCNVEANPRQQALLSYWEPTSPPSRRAAKQASLACLRAERAAS